MAIQTQWGQFEALLFDLDGTLADTMALHNQAWIEVLGHYGCKMTPEILKIYAGVPNQKTIEIFNERFAWKLDPVKVAKEKEFHVMELLDSVEAIPPTKEIVLELYGKIPLAIVSGGHLELVEFLLNKIGLKKYFSVIITAESTLQGKPSPDPFLLAAKKLSVAPQNCLVFEDGQPGIDGAKACGMAVVQVMDDFNFRLLPQE